ncbi:hypothetical protein B0H14DRAFT_3594889 [Mycena olivaceomarginata]|nr:hypothetical protein B0H14DRAFT_3594889 [Mycena olivaceomarginata]
MDFSSSHCPPLPYVFVSRVSTCPPRRIVVSDIYVVPFSKWYKSLRVSFYRWFGSDFLITMSTFDAPRLSLADEAAIRKLLKTLRATRYEDPVDQDAFLVASANSVLPFRPQVASFALVSEVGECVFTLRSALHSNNARLPNPSTDILTAIQDFAGEIACKRQLFHERNRAQADRARAAEGVAARAERRAALKHAARVNKPPSTDEDAVSIPSSGEESDAEEPSGIQHPSSPIVADVSTTAVPSSTQAPLSPLSDLDAQMDRLRVRSPPSVPLASPSSPSPSLPALVPIASYRLRGHVSRANVPFPRQTGIAAPQPILERAVIRNAKCNFAVLVPRPIPVNSLRPKPNYVDDWLASTRKSGGSHARRNTSAGSSKRFKTHTQLNQRQLIKIPKRCFYCSSHSHLVATCPMRADID